jgi:tripartite-type tricarboxylate transporter receptor subunit TctC
MTGIRSAACTPAPILNRLGAEIRKAIELPEVIERLGSIGGYPRNMTAAEAVAFVQTQQRQWQPVLEIIAQQTK